MTTMELEAGAVFGGDFTIVRPLRVGGMGAVYVAEQRSTGAKRALKLMQRELVKDPGLRERFEQEARVGASIESDHVVQVVAAGIDVATDVPWIAMELLEGMPLDDYLKAKGARPAGEVRFLLEQFCHAIAAAHDKGIIHRDLKPANVFLCTPRIVGLSYVVKVLDFGIAKVLAEAKTARTAAVGTPLYMAPEQYEAGRVTPATDVWALGLIAFELLTGKSYWKGASDNPTPASIMYETCLGELSPASQRGGEMPPGFDEWFGKCVDRKPENRFVDARAAMEALAPILGASTPPTDPLIPSTSTRVAQTKPMTLAMTKDATAIAPAPLAASGSERVPPNKTEIAAQPAIPAPAKNNSKRIAAAIYAVGGAIVATMIVLAMMKKDDTPPPEEPAKTAKQTPSAKPSATTATLEPHHFAAGNTVNVEGRTLHSAIPAGGRTETYLMLELRGKDAAPKTIVPVHLALVIDRSGSMKGGRLQKAIAGATTAIERLRDGDKVTVIAFDQTAETVVKTVALDPKSRVEALAAVKKLSLGGDTCMSCGITSAIAAVSTTSDTRRVLVLSDGAANFGVKDVAGLEKIAQEAQKQDINITTIGVGDDYDPRALTAIARESNGQHYYAENEAALPGIFDQQATALANAVATATEATIKLAPGVELITVMDRAHRKEGNVVKVPLGQLVRDEKKTVLIKVAVSPKEPGLVPLCDVDVTYRDLLDNKDGATHGTLGVVTGESTSVDAIVEARVRRSETAAALLEANKLFADGKAKEADKVLSTQQKKLADQKKKWEVAPPPAPTTAANVKKDVDAQDDALASAKKGYGDAAGAPKPAAAAPAKKAANKAAAEANAYGY
jgi:Ca-activated chloride channel homolog